MAQDISADQDIVLELRDITKKFGDFTALHQASFNLKKGEVHALLGENGAGKSTLMNVVCGLYAADSGQMSIDGGPVVVENPSHAHSMGIGMVHQHYKLVEPFTALENIQLEYGRGRFRQSMNQLREQATELADRLGFAVDLDKRVAAMSVSEQQRVEILKVLTANARILILDEPTAVLTDIEADAMFDAMRALAAHGATVVFVTHKLREALSFADRITVMRAGKVISTVFPADVSATDLTTMIVGEKIVEIQRLSQKVGAPRIKLNDITVSDEKNVEILDKLSFEVCAGEVYGIAGVGGNGQDELTSILTGLSHPDTGTVTIEGHGDISNMTPRKLRDIGFAAIHSDRARFGLANDMSIADNYAVSGVLAGEYGHFSKIDKASIRKRAKDAIKSYDVRGVQSLNQKAALLSGGNAQKLVIAREFSRDTQVVIAHSPCRGLDVRAASAVHGYLHRARDNGAAVILISEDLDEILLMSDRIGVLSRGTIAGEFTAPADRHAIGRAMVGHA